MPFSLAEWRQFIIYSRWILFILFYFAVIRNCACLSVIISITMFWIRTHSQICYYCLVVLGVETNQSISTLLLTVDKRLVVQSQTVLLGLSMVHGCALPTNRFDIHLLFTQANACIRYSAGSLHFMVLALLSIYMKALPQHHCHGHKPKDSECFSWWMSFSFHYL